LAISAKNRRFPSDPADQRSRNGRMLQTLRNSDPPAPLQAVLDASDAVVLSKRDELRPALACLLTRGRVLIEDVPGVGKTALPPGKLSPRMRELVARWSADDPPPEIGAQRALDRFNQ
jgi:hypothetical protein